MGLTLAWNSELEEAIPESWLDKLKVILHKAGMIEGIADGEVALTFVDDDAIAQLNETYRGVEGPTDVLSFPMQERLAEEMDIVWPEQDPAETRLLGDIVISVPKAKEQSEAYGHSLEREIGFLFVHGFLHLVGYDHDSEEAEKRMFEKQERILAEVGLTR